MTTDKAIGRTVQEFRDRTQRATAIRSELRRIGDSLATFGLDLQERPTPIQLGSERFSSEDLLRIVHPPHAETFNVDRIGGLVSELRTLEDSLKVLRREIRELGLGLGSSPRGPWVLPIEVIPQLQLPVGARSRRWRCLRLLARSWFA